jgi:glucose-1-phosphate adenylyltransferase
MSASADSKPSIPPPPQLRTAPPKPAVKRQWLARAPSPLMRQTLALVLAGGRGARLANLTDWRAKPAVSFGGKFRIIDFALSNCVNSGIRRIGVCVQYKSQSLIGHLQRGWGFLDGRLGEFIELLPAQQRMEPVWYQGTADAVYQNLDIIRRHDPEFVLVLAGDHIYRMDCQRLLLDHTRREAEMTVACIEVPRAQATQLGVMQVDADGRVTGFQEKPADPQPLPGRPDTVLASMGIYAFDAAFLYRALILDAADPSSRHDFGRDVIPRLIAGGARVYAHNFADSCVNRGGDAPYWRDVGTVDAYWEANLDLTRVVPELNLYDRAWPIWTYQEQLPPAKFVFDQDGRRGIAVDSLVDSGCILSGCTVRRSLLSSNVRVNEYALIEDSVVLPHVEIGAGAVIRRAVIDKYCIVPAGMTIGVDVEQDRQRFHLTKGGVTLVTPAMLGQVELLPPATIAACGDDPATAQDAAVQAPSL